MVLLHSSVRRRGGQLKDERRHDSVDSSAMVHRRIHLLNPFMEPANPMICHRLLPILLFAMAAAPASAQDTTVIQLENVRFAYAQVLRVTPVYQTLTATAMEERCAPEVEEDESGSRLSRVVGAVKGVLGRQGEETGSAAGRDCVVVPVQREFQRPIAYDVDYVYKGSKYRSRLPEDPGNRLRIRIGVTPVVSGIRDSQTHP